MWYKRRKKWEYSDSRYLRGLVFCDMGWVNHFTGGLVVLRALLGVRRMTDMVMREQTTTMTSRAMAMPFQFLWGGLTPPRSWGRTRRRKEHRWGQEMWGLAARLSTRHVSQIHFDTRNNEEVRNSRGGGGRINNEKEKRVNLGSWVIIVKNLSAHCICLFVCLLWQPACIFCRFGWVADNESCIKNSCFLSQNTPCCLLSLFLYSCGETLESTLTRVINILLTRSHFLRSQHRSCRGVFPRT